MHLTNYALNKQNANYQFNKTVESEDTGSKQSYTSVLERLRRDGCDTEMLQRDINDLFIKTIFGILPNLQHGYVSTRPGVPTFIGDTSQSPFDDQAEYFGSNYFEILGFDVMIDD